MALKYLLDTSVYSQPIRPRPLPACETKWQKLGDKNLAVSAIVIAELEYGLFLKDSKKLWEAYRSILKGRLEILDFTAEVATTFGEMKARQAQAGKTVDDFDLSIAAHAVHYNLKLATLNHQHFKLIDDLEWEDWSVT
jgi:predicted nucleic acid-binding protein